MRYSRITQKSNPTTLNLRYPATDISCCCLNHILSHPSHSCYAICDTVIETVATALFFTGRRAWTTFRFHHSEINLTGHCFEFVRFCDRTCLVCLQEDLENGEEVATCPSCSLIVKVIYDKVSGPVLNMCDV